MEDMEATNQPWDPVRRSGLTWPRRRQGWWWKAGTARSSELRARGPWTLKNPKMHPPPHTKKIRKKEGAFWRRFKEAAKQTKLKCPLECTLGLAQRLEPWPSLSGESAVVECGWAQQLDVVWWFLQLGPCCREMVSSRKDAEAGRTPRSRIGKLVEGFGRPACLGCPVAS